MKRKYDSMEQADDCARSLTAQEVLSTQCSLAWQLPPPAGGERGAALCVRIEHRVEGSDGDWTKTDVPAERHEHVVQELLPATVYRFRLRLVFASGPAATATPPLRVETPVGLPQAPKALCISKRTPTSLTLAWQAGHDGGSPIETFEVQYHALGPEFTEWSRAPVRRSPSIIKSLREHERYEVRVRARTAFGWSEPSAACEAVLDQECLLPTPPAPTVLAVTEKGTQLQVDVSSAGVTAGLSLIIYSRTAHTEWTARSTHTLPHKGGPTLSLACDCSGLGGGEDVFLSVRGKNECGIGPIGNALMYESRPGTPELSVKKHGHSWVILEWTEAGSAQAEYELSMLQEGAGEWRVLKTDLRRAVCIKRNLEARTGYTFRVRTRVGAKTSNYSNAVAVQTKTLEEYLERVREKVKQWTQSTHHPGMHMLAVQRDRLLDETLSLFMPPTPEVWAGEIFVSFVGEDGSDYGALHREWLRLFVDQMTHADRALFTRINAGLAQPSHLHRLQDNSLSLFRLLGLALARALLRDCRVDTRFSPIVYKQLLGQTVTLDDLRAVDPELHRNLQWLRDNDVTDLGLTFAHEVHEFDTVKTVPLVPGGTTKSVTNENKEEFIKLRCRACLASMIEEPLRAMQEGFQALVPPNLLSDCSVADLQLALCGNSVLSVHEWKRHAMVTENMRAHPHVVKNFWDIVGEMTPLQRNRLLMFATASAALPAGGFAQLNPPFTLEAMIHGPPGALPVAHACFCVLELPVWHDYDTLRSKLITAVSETGGYGLA